MLRWIFSACAFAVCLFASEAGAQGQTYNIGERTIGAVHSLNLTARNRDCTQPLDFRFDFAPSPWLRPREAAIVRGVAAGESRPLPVIVDLTQMPPGRHTAEVTVSCENCTSFFIRNCGFDRQQLLITVDAVAPPASPVATPETTVAPPPTRRSPPPPETQETPPAPVTSAEPEFPQVTASPAPADESVTVSESAAAPCPGSTLVAGLAAAAAIASLIALGGLGWAANASKAMRTLKDAARPSNGLADFLREKAEECRDLCNTTRSDLEALLRAQHQAARLLSALSLLNVRSDEAQIAEWNRVCADAGYGIDANGNTIVRRRSDTRLADNVAAVFASKPGFILVAAPGEDARAAHKARIANLRLEGFAPDDEGAQAVLDEAASYISHGHSMRDMNRRLAEQAEECRRCEAELAAFIARTSVGL